MSTTSLSASAVLDALRAIKDPDLHRDIVELGFVKDLKIDGSRVSFTIELTTPACPVKDQMRDQARAAIVALPGVTSVDIAMTANVRTSMRPDMGPVQVPGIKNVIAVGAGKGGVGKTTVAVNLAIALAQAGSRVGIIDGDIGSIMLGIRGQLMADGEKSLPSERYGVKVVSMGFLTTDESPVIWRGPMLHSVIRQFFQ